jgi:Fe-S-cluster containining protein
LSQRPDNNTGIKEIYKQLEAELASINPGCNACGTCCHFDEFGHVLYTSTIETDYIRDNVEIPDFDSDKNVCPFLVNYECSIREHRALGCRVFFCNPNHKETLQGIYEKYYTMIKDLAIDNEVEWQYAPMLKMLENKQQKNQL